MPSFSYKDVIKRLKKAGMVFWRQGKGSHELWKNPNTKKIFPVPKHPHNLKLGTVANIAKQAGFKNITEFQDFL